MGEEERGRGGLWRLPKGSQACYVAAELSGTWRRGEVEEVIRGPAMPPYFHCAGEGQRRCFALLTETRVSVPVSVFFWIYL